MLRIRVCAVMGVLFGAYCFSEGVVLPTVFSDHMVLQRDQAVPVWGTAEPGETISVQFDGQEKSAVTGEDGKWMIILDPMTASSESQVLQVLSLKSHVSFFDVLVGEVWLCSGQSNMEWPLWHTEGADAEIADAGRYSQIRLYQAPRTLADRPGESIDARWSVSFPDSAKSFSGTAWYFGKKLHEDLRVPVGLVLSAWGGTGIAGWIAPEGFEQVEAVRHVAKPARNPKLTGEEKADRQLPAVLYNGMIHPHIPFAIRGVIWYQGEANRLIGRQYVDLSRALIEGWRQLWGYDFPFYFVQIAPYQYGGEKPTILPEFWEAQSDVVQMVPRTGMAVVSDAATPDCIHPPNKKVPGTRVALLAEQHTYGMDVVSSGPVFESMETAGGALRVTFSSAEGLTTRDGKAPDWFEIAGADGVFRSAVAAIDGCSVVLRAEGIAAPQAVRFGWNKLAMPNLMNGAGLPASSFRASDVPGKAKETISPVEPSKSVSRSVVPASGVEKGSFEEQAGRFHWDCVPQSGLPNVLIIGDSISIGYTIGVRKELDGVANIYRPLIQSEANRGLPENATDTRKSMGKMADWLCAADRWDVIHFNWGLHDLRRNSPSNPAGSPDLPNNVSLDEYEQNLQALVDVLKSTGATLIFGLTTPVPEGVSPCRVPDDVVRYNEVALKVMERNGVAVDDLYVLTKNRLKELQQTKNVHFNAAGNRVLTLAVAEKIRAALDQGRVTLPGEIMNP